jgi:hypothetical protein
MLLIEIDDIAGIKQPKSTRKVLGKDPVLYAAAAIARLNKCAVWWPDGEHNSFPHSVVLKRRTSISSIGGEVKIGFRIVECECTSRYGLGKCPVHQVPPMVWDSLSVKGYKRKRLWEVWCPLCEKENLVHGTSVRVCKSTRGEAAKTWNFVIEFGWLAKRAREVAVEKARRRERPVETTEVQVPSVCDMREEH